MAVEMKKEIVGYGDLECSNGCQIRQEHPYLCNLAVLLTDYQIETAKRGDLDRSSVYEALQNEVALMLRCLPAYYRI